MVQDENYHRSQSEQSGNVIIDNTDKVSQIDKHIQIP